MLCHFTSCCSKTKPKPCSGCEVISYCSKQCQKKDWNKHKRFCCYINTCKTSKNIVLKQYLKSVQDNIRFEYLNPRNDRTIKFHAYDAQPVECITKIVKELLSEMKLNCKDLIKMKHDTECKHGNCFDIVKKHKGEKVFGWCLYEGNFMVEAEPHAVIKSQNDYLNVTKTCQGVEYNSYFIRDDRIIGDKKPANIIYWK